MKEDLETMKKKYGCNGIAFPIYPASQQAYDLCDELGILATGENDFWGWEEQDAMLSSQQYDRLLRSAERHLRKMVEQYGHHPSIFIWSVSCENGCSPRVRALNSHMIAYTRHLDPTRPVMHVTNKLSNDTFEADDVVGCDIYGKGNHATRAIEGAKKLAPNKPVLMKEFGGPVNKGIRYGVRLPEADEARFIHEYHPQGIEAAFQNMLTEARKDTAMARLAGGFVWVWASHPWPVKDGKYAYGAPLSPFGIHTRDRKVYPEHVKILQKDYIRRIIRLYEEEVLADR
jgi:beta-galactosidase/beta-glucuronidase